MKLIVTCLFLVLGLCHGLNNHGPKGHDGHDTEEVDISPEPKPIAIADKLEDGEDNQEAPVLHLKVTDPKTNVTCILAQFSAKVDLKNGNDTKTLLINGTTGDGSGCGQSKQKLMVVDRKKGSLVFDFTRANESVILKSISFVLSNYTTYTSNDSKTLFQVTASNSFKCDSGLTVDLHDGHDDDNLVTLTLKSMRVDAFREKSDDEFDPDSVCSADVKSNKTVPMIIAFVLAGMIVIILVGYIILRRREDRSAYQSV